MTRDQAAALRLVGSGVAVVIAMAIAAVVSVAWQFDGLWAGVPSVLVLGFWLGPRAVDRPATAAIVLMIGAVVLSALVVAMTASTDTATHPLSIVAVAAIGIAIFGLPALLVTGPAAVAWLHVVRWIAARGVAPLG
jgi:sugar phosphate permease